jgi:flagellar basal-body rod protein FlgF
MLYGLYLSATGIINSEYKQDVIANNLANSETTGFKRDIAGFQQRLTAEQERRNPSDWSDSVLEGLGGGTLLQPTRVDTQQGDLMPTGTPLDVGLQGDGFFTVQDKGKTRLTRDGRFMVDRDGFLSQIDGRRVLDPAGNPIAVSQDMPVSIDKNGNVIQGSKPVGTLGIYTVADKSTLTKLGNNLMSYSGSLQPSNASIHSEFLERSNADPTSEMAQLMETQRQLEANANLIHTMDSMLQLLVNNVGKIS